MVAIIIRSILHWISDSFGCKWKLHFQSQIEYYIEVSLFCRGRGPRTKIPQVYISQLQKQDSGYKGAKPIDPWASGTLIPIFINVRSKSIFPEADSAEVTKAISQKQKQTNKKFPMDKWLWAILHITFQSWKFTMHVFILKALISPAVEKLSLLWLTQFPQTYLIMQFLFFIQWLLM